MSLIPLNYFLKYIFSFKFSILFTVLIQILWIIVRKQLEPIKNTLNRVNFKISTVYKRFLKKEIIN